MGASPHLEHHPGPMPETVLSPPRPQQQPPQPQPLLQTPQPLQGGQVVMQRAPAAPQGAIPHQAGIQPQPLMSQVPMSVQQVQGQGSPAPLLGLQNQVLTI